MEEQTDLGPVLPGVDQPPRPPVVMDLRPEGADGQPVVEGDGAVALELVRHVLLEGHHLPAQVVPARGNSRHH